MTIFPVPGHHTPPLHLVAHSAHLRGLQWVPVPYTHPSATPKDGTPPTTPSIHGRNGKTESPVIPLVPSQGLDPSCVLRVWSQGRRGVPLSKFDMKWMDDRPNERGTVYRESLVHIDAVRAVVDSPDWCVCHLVPGPTVRIAGIGAEVRVFIMSVSLYRVLTLWIWTTVARDVRGAARVSGAEGDWDRLRVLHVREAMPARRRALPDLVDQRGASVSDQEEDIIYAHVYSPPRLYSFQQERRAEEMRTTGIRLERLPFVIGPGTIPLENLVLVAIRRRHIALGVYEWLPELEVVR